MHLANLLLLFTFGWFRHIRRMNLTNILVWCKWNCQYRHFLQVLKYLRIGSTFALTLGNIVTLLRWRVKYFSWVYQSSWLLSSFPCMTVLLQNAAEEEKVLWIAHIALCYTCQLRWWTMKQHTWICLTTTSAISLLVVLNAWLLCKPWSFFITLW